MPIYEYECENCGCHVEAWQKFSDPALTECEACHSRLRKLISHSAFHLKGTGWYVTDYAAKSRPNSSAETGSTKTEPQNTTEKAPKKETATSGGES